MNQTMEKTKRIFIAAEFPDIVIQQLAAVVKQQWPDFTQGIRWVPTTQYHLTLKFIGDYPVSGIPAIQEVLHSTYNQINAIPLTLSGFGVFPNPRQPRVLWAGIKAADTLIDSQKQLEKGLAAMGIPPENRAFSPHLTLARVKDDFPSNRLPALLHPMNAENNPFHQPTTVIRITLFESQLSRQGAIYRSIESLKIG